MLNANKKYNKIPELIQTQQYGFCSCILFYLYRNIEQNRVYFFRTFDAACEIMIDFNVL